MDLIKKKPHLILIATAAVIILDQITKLIAKKYFTTIHNTGAAFGLFQNSTLFLIIISIIVIAAILYLYKSIF